MIREAIRVANQISQMRYTTRSGARIGLQCGAPLEMMLATGKPASVAQSWYSGKCSSLTTMNTFFSRGSSRGHRASLPSQWLSTGREAAFRSGLATDLPSGATRNPAPLALTSCASVRPNELATRINLHGAQRWRPGVDLPGDV